jgi:hypothetical protein
VEEGGGRKKKAGGIGANNHVRVRERHRGGVRPAR